MRELPILFNSEMVRAILDGRKTQTRRPAKIVDRDYGTWSKDAIDAVIRHHAKYQVGDRVYVRENFFVNRHHHDGICLYYSADGAGHGVPIKSENYEVAQALYKREHEKVFHRPGIRHEFKTIPSIHMPKWAARIWLEVVGVRVERVQDITRTDIRAEGVTIPPHMSNEESYKAAYLKAWVETWETVYPGSWERNEWVFVYEFKKASVK